MGRFSEIAESLGASRPGMIPLMAGLSGNDLMHNATDKMNEILPGDGVLFMPEDKEVTPDTEGMDYDPGEESESSTGAKPQDHVMTTDSYGKLR